jgi:hypothetical protein
MKNRAAKGLGIKTELAAVFGEFFLQNNWATDSKCIAVMCLLLISSYKQER